jgi:hypothetical protein
MESRTFHYPNASLSLPETLQWLQGFKNLKGGCIDGPPNPNTGALRDRLPRNTALNTNRRLTEFQIGIGGCYSTRNVPPNPGASNYWMQSSFELFGLLSQGFGWTIDKGNGGGQLIETHPTYAFKALLGCNRNEVHGIQRLRLDPQSRLRRKHSPAGHSQRIELLTALCDESEIVITDELQERWSHRIDWVDAAICAFMSYWQQTGNHQIESPGDLDEGTIFLRIQQQPLQVNGNPVAAPVHARPPARAGIPHYRLNGIVTSANAIVLRLGDTSELSQFDTIDAVNSADEDEFWFPCGSNAQFNLTENLAMVGGRFFLAWGNRLQLCLTVIDVLKNDVRIPYPANGQNPFPQVQSKIWLKVTMPVEVDTDEFFVNHSRQWSQGFGLGQRALLWAVVPQNEGQAQ